jgi:hypothetical protein
VNVEVKLPCNMPDFESAQFRSPREMFYDTQRGRFSAAPVQHFRSRECDLNGISGQLDLYDSGMTDSL